MITEICIFNVTSAIDLMLALIFNNYNQSIFIDVNCMQSCYEIDKCNAIVIPLFVMIITPMTSAKFKFHFCWLDKVIPITVFLSPAYEERRESTVFTGVYLFTGGTPSPFHTPWTKFRKYYDFLGGVRKFWPKFYNGRLWEIFFYFLFVYTLVFEVSRSNY